MRYCKIKSCENFKGIQNPNIHLFRQIKKWFIIGFKLYKYREVIIKSDYFDRFPTDTVTKTAWDLALNKQECSSSQWICSEHFTPNDYKISKDKKRYSLKPGVIPTVFDVFLIEVNEDGYNNVDDVEMITLDEEKCENSLEQDNLKLRKEVEQLKCFQNSQNYVNISRVERCKQIQKKQSNEIRDLKMQVEQLKSSIEQMEKEKQTRSKLTVSTLDSLICVNHYFMRE